MPRTLIAVTDSPFPSLEPAQAALKRVDPELRMAASASAEDILAVARDADAILVTYAKLPGELLRQLTRCKVIGRFGLGVDNIDIKAAAELGIAVTYVPDYCMQEVSDHAMALLLALARKVPLSNKLVQAGRWEIPPVAPMHRLSGRVLGLVGFGNIPRTLAPKAKAFGLRVVAHDPFVEEGAFLAAGVEGVAFDVLLEISDFVSIHAPLVPATRGLFNADVLRKMKKGALLINTARGPLVDEQALIAALELRPPRRRCARCGRGRAAASRFQASRARQCHSHAAYRLLFGRGAQRAANQMRDGCRARPLRRAPGLPGEAGVNSPVMRGRDPRIHVVDARRSRRLGRLPSPLWGGVGVGSGVGVVTQDSSLSHHPPPRPSPTRGEGADTVCCTP